MTSRDPDAIERRGIGSRETAAFTDSVIRPPSFALGLHSPRSSVGRHAANDAVAGKVMQKSLKVGSWIVDPSLNSMSSEGRTVRLEPKVMGVLVCLAQRPGERFPRSSCFRPCGRTSS